MPRYKITFSRLKPESLSVFVEDELDELDDEGAITNGWDILRDYLEANNIETAGWDDSRVDWVEY